MSYKLSIKGNTRAGLFTIDEKTGTVQCMKKVKSEAEEKNDCLSWVIIDPQNGSNLEENWIVLHGKPWQIVWTIDNRYPMAKLMTNPIFDYLDTVGKDDIVTLAYPVEEPSFLIKRSLLHRAMRSSAEDVICDLFEVREVKILVREKRTGAPSNGI